MKNSTDLITQFKSLEGLSLLHEYDQLIKLCDTLLADFPEQLRTEPFYGLTLDVIDRAFSLQIGFGSNKLYDNSDFYHQLLIRQWKLFKLVVPANEKMQKVVDRFYKG